MEVIVSSEHRSNYPNPLQLKSGESVSLGQLDDEFPNWIFVTSQTGVKGWAPVEYIEKQPCGLVGLMRCDYDAKELNTVLGEKLTVLYELNCWYKVSRNDNEVGWVPVKTVVRT